VVAVWRRRFKIGHRATITLKAANINAAAPLHPGDDRNLVTISRSADGLDNRWALGSRYRASRQMISYESRPGPSDFISW